MLQKVNDKVMLGAKAYTFCKRLVQVIIPALSTFYFTLGSIWGFPSVEKVVGTFACVATFGGVCLGLSSKQYNSSGAALKELEDATVHDGDLVIQEKEDGRKLMTLDLENAPEGVEKKGSVSFKVVHK